MANVTKAGPGTLKLGATTGTEFGCQFLSAGINVDANTDDSVTVLCGDVVAGGMTLTYTLAGTVLQDLAVASGLVEYSWTHAGESVPFEFTPNTAAGATATGSVVMVPINFGQSDGDSGSNLQADIEWVCDGKPTITWHTEAAA